MRKRNGRFGSGERERWECLYNREREERKKGVEEMAELQSWPLGERQLILVRWVDHPPSKIPPQIWGLGFPLL